MYNAILIYIYITDLVTLSFKVSFLCFNKLLFNCGYLSESKKSRQEETEIKLKTYLLMIFLSDLSSFSLIGLEYICL